MRPYLAATDAPRPPARPGRLEERLASGLFFALGPRLPRTAQPSPPPELAPWEPLRLPRSGGRPGALDALWVPARTTCAAGAVLLLHPWTEWGKAYFYRRGRIAALHDAGFHVLVIDLSGFGRSGPRRGFLDLDVDDALAVLADRCPRQPLFVWGVSSGGYWAHPALARRSLVSAAVFEDVSPHLMEWSWRTAPWGRPAFLFFRRAFRRSYRFLDLRAHAPHLGLYQVAYVSGAGDPGVRPDDTTGLARLTGGAALVVPGAGHLGSIKRAESKVIALALEVFTGARSRAASA